jgi:putative tricarboxylic transport membrane protein
MPGGRVRWRDHEAAAGSRAELAFALGAIALGALLFAGLAGISPGAGYDRIGPRFFPFVVAAGLVVIGAAIGVAALFRPLASRAHASAAEPVYWRPAAYLLAALLLSMALLERAGFVVAASLQFWLVARAFHSRRPWRDAIVAVALVVCVYVLFSRGLGLTLPVGPFWNDQ